MKLLLDTCTLLWWWSEPAKLSSRSLAMLRDPANEVLVSAASAWEAATKHRIGKFPPGAAVLSEWSDRLSVDGFRELAMGEIIALAHPDNGASRRVIEKLGMQFDRVTEYFGMQLARYKLSAAMHERSVAETSRRA
jgi:hypothetical protein